MRSKFLMSITSLFILGGCMVNPTNKSIQSFQTPTPTTRLQITYIRDEQEQNFSGFYTIDITCMTQDKACFGEPKLLFQSLKMPNNEQNKPKGLLTDYSWSPDGNKIALISGRDILVGNMLTQEWINITNNPDSIDEHNPKWSRDGKSIYYISCLRDSSSTCMPKLLRLDLSGKEQSHLLSSMNTIISNGYDVSPDGRRIVFTISGPLAISDLLYLANSDGTDSHQMTTKDVSENAPSFSPDEQKIAFVRSTILYDVNSKEESDIIVKDLISGEERNLTENLDSMAFSPAFSPSGDWVVFESFDSDLNVNIFLASVKQEVIIQVTHGNNEANPAWRSFSE